MEVQHLKVVWRFAGMRPGALYVMDPGQDLMHKWPADSWDTQQLVSNAWYRDALPNCRNATETA